MKIEVEVDGASDGEFEEHTPEWILGCFETDHIQGIWESTVMPGYAMLAIQSGACYRINMSYAQAKGCWITGDWGEFELK